MSAVAQGYDPATVEAVEEDTRFWRPATVAGWGCSPARGMVSAWGELAKSRPVAEPIAPSRELVKQVSLVNGVVVLEDRGYYVGVQSRQNARPSQVSKPKIRGGALLDEFFRGGDVYAKLWDAGVWVAVKECVQAHADEVDAVDLREISTTVALQLLRRAGYILSANDLPPSKPFARSG